MILRRAIMPQCQYLYPCLIIWLKMYVAVCNNCKRQQIDENSCIVKLKPDTMTAAVECDVKSNNSSTLTANISSLGYRGKCDCSKFKIECALENMQSLERYYTISAYDTQVCINEKIQDINFLPFDIVEPNSIEWDLKSISSYKCRIKLVIPYVAFDYYAPDNESWVFNLTYFPSQAEENKTISRMVKKDRTTIKLKDLHPYKNYTFLIQWKFATMRLWSDASEYVHATKIGVPSTVPTIPEKNYAHGINETAIYLQRKPEDIANGPVIAYHVNVSSGFSEVFPGDLRTLYLPVNDGQYHTVTISMATAAGVSQHFTTVYILPVSSTENKKLKRVEIVNQDTDFTELLVEDLQDGEKLFIFWCWGIVYTSTNLVECKSDIESKEINYSREPVLIPTPEHEGVNCGECSLHYGAAIQTDNVTSSLLWDSASLSKIEETLDSNEVYYLFIPGVLLFIMLCAVVIKCCRSIERYPINSLQFNEGAGTLQYSSNSLFNSDQFLLSSSKPLESSQSFLLLDNGLSKDSLLTTSDGKCSSERTDSTDDIRVTPKSSEGSTSFMGSTSSDPRSQCPIIISSAEKSV